MKDVHLGFDFKDITGGVVRPPKDEILDPYYPIPEDSPVKDDILW